MLATASTFNKFIMCEVHAMLIMTKLCHLTMRKSLLPNFFVCVHWERCDTSFCFYTFDTYIDCYLV